MVRGSNAGGDEIFRTCPDGPSGPPTLLYSGYRPFPWSKAAGLWRWPPTPSSAEVKESVELYLYSLSGPSRPVVGWPLPLPYHYSLRYNPEVRSSRSVCVFRRPPQQTPVVLLNNINCMFFVMDTHTLLRDVGAEAIYISLFDWVTVFKQLSNLASHPTFDYEGLNLFTRSLAIMSNYWMTINNE